MTDMRPFCRDGLGLALHDTGGEGRVVLFQHGLLGDARQTEEAFPKIEGLRRLTLECRGHGGSFTGPREALSLTTFTEDCAAMLAAETSGPVVVGGISMGAAIALRLAVTRPERVAGLILVRPAWGTARAPETMRPNAEVGALLSRLGPTRGKAEFAASKTALRLAGEAPDNLASLLGFFDRPDPMTTAALLQQISADGPDVSEDDLARIEVPVLVIGTGMDAIHPLALAEALAGLIPGAVFLQITPKGQDRARHFSELHAAISGFLKDHIQ
ncbi:alpha/beta hydrolase [Arsenicitalea aurantiaca]|uniref:Alpha/beta hydrolase n=1 Tax=Arsenicitalea aurantiaca TaxID=1783274 RepID=A0A433XBI9_9HYPH|nr:alpha/beta hydrolase [Arsenicitalea aurantiaca]RUT31358.1 alpha/beta hydrolase [Arsenicitalea aurantiaca]